MTDHVNCGSPLRVGWESSTAARRLLGLLVPASRHAQAESIRLQRFRVIAKALGQNGLFANFSSRASYSRACNSRMQNECEVFLWR